MANVKITDLTAYTDAASTDVLPIVDVANNVTKKISISDILKATPAGTAALPAIAIDGDPNTGIWSPAADTLAVSTGGTERVRLDSSGRLLVGTSSATTNGGVLQVSNGITFPATQSACSDANTLDDYEEGTWTPTFSSASATFSYSYQSGRYTKIGNTVHLYAYIQASASGTLTNAISISSLPFTPNAGVTAYSAISLDSNSGANHVAGYVNPAASISIDSAPGTSATPSFLGMTGSRWVMLGGSYQT
jgi:hypothetical protein